MLKVNGCEANYNQLFIYDDNGKILYKTERPYDLNIDITINIRNARKLVFNKHDCFEMKTDGKNGYLYTRNGKDLYIHNSIISIIGIEEKLSFKAYGETNYKDVYILKLNYADGQEIKVESDYYTRTEKTDDRLYREKLAKIMSECMYGDKYVSHYEIEKILEKLDITIKE